jgi:predicted ribosomally synthesized peptide with nif11-like leader
MSISDAARFAKDLATDKDLLEKVKGKASGLASLVELGKVHGYNFTFDEIKQVVQGTAKREMTDAELDVVAGGKGKAPAPGSPSPAGQAPTAIQVVAMDAVNISSSAVIVAVIV